MNILGLFEKQKKFYGDYTQSQHVALYEQIAARLGTSAQHVYEIAHGKSIRCHDDYVILYALKQARIVE